ncbi:MAG: hypothetical protein DWQ29_12100 [Planctomycetota bacterium]|nr:MAG: hypothetical protein DWQ29_12100 [Planctomycetota bacterium]
MKVHQFLDHYGITENPFAQEDALSDRVFLDHCLAATHHSAWDKIFGDPRAAATSVVFGEQGSGKTALRLQIKQELQRYNREHPEARAFVVEYDDFNPYLDCFRERLNGRRRKPENALKNWRLWDHMDAILTLAVTRLANAIRNDGRDPKDETQNIDMEKLHALPREQRRDILLLAAFYDDNRDLAPRQRWQKLRWKLRYFSWKKFWVWALGLLVTVGVVAGVIAYHEGDWKKLFEWWGWWAIIAAGWLPCVWDSLRRTWIGWRARNQIRVFDHRVRALRKNIGGFETSEYAGQPLPTRPRGDDRYELLLKLQSVLKLLGFESIYVLMDRVDEPHLINGAAERMRDFVWPMFDNKFLKHPGIAFKLLLPIAMSGYLQQQEREFYDRSRLDKQNLVSSLTWTGQGLYDIANDRIRACAKLAEGKPPGIMDFFDPSINETELIGILDRLRVPRNLFKFLYRLLVDHCSKYTEDNPEWKIKRETLQSSLAVFLKDLEAYEQRRGTG